MIANDLGTKENEKLILTKHAHPALGRVHDSLVKVEQQGVIMSARATTGILEIALRVEAVDGPSSLDAFEGVYRMGSVQDLTGSASPTINAEVLDQDKKFSLKEYLASSSNFEDLKKAQNVLDFESYTFSIARPRYLKVGAGETATKRDVEYMVSTRVIDNVWGTSVGEKTKFIVELPNGERKEVSSDSEGYIRWNSKLTHQYYQPEKFFFEDVKIYSADGKRLLGKKSFAINPWDDKFTFGWDRMEMEDKFFDDIQKRELIPSRFYIDQFSYHTLRFRYQIDKFMNLQVMKTILLEIRPQVLRYSGIVGGRKVTEDIRDGIYLLKVAIQKDYLDPAEKGVFIKNRKTRQDQKTQKKEIAKKYFVDVATKLVQVFDGHIITPVELSMSDLRLMRVRSQFLIQLETVDEEKIQVSNLVNQKHWSHLKQRRQNYADRLDAAKEDEVKRDQIRDNLLKEKKERQKQLSGILMWLNDKTIRDPDFAKSNGLSDADLATLFKRLEVNDFSKFDLSPYADPDLYLDKQSGIGRRTFVGPMIFLSNAYSDSVRPTDSLNEVDCETNDCNYIEELRRLKGYTKSNENYEHNPYFGSIAHLANVSVDDFIGKRLDLDENYYNKMPQIASLGNFADSFDLHLVSLSNEPFFSLKDNCDVDKEKSCEVPSSRQIKTGNLPYVFTGMSQNSVAPITVKHLNAQSVPISLVIEKRKQLGRPFDAQEFKTIWSSKALSPEYAEWVCYMIAGRSSENENYSYRLNRVYKECLNEYLSNPEGFITVDRKLRVNKTGSYEFRGGKQMNLNVGSSFSVGHSSSVSISSGVELEDIVGMVPFVGETLKKAVKPLSLKVGSSESTSFSDGTSVSEQTYLVMQMANFTVDLDEYERCMILKPQPEWIKSVEGDLIKSRKRQTNEPGSSEELKVKGLMMCSGEMSKEPRSVMESYFYFTQHFTEGDMLDQYDLYNHPWLLALRGVRDFTHFAKLLRKQSDKDAQWYSAINPLTYINFVTTSVGDAKTAKPWEKTVDKTGWPLDKMAETYRKILPSYPGLYTIVGEDEFIQDYPWEIEHTDPDFLSSKGFDSKNGPNKKSE